MYRLVFEKLGDSVWMSHLDLMRVFQRAFRRAGLALTHSRGFTPRAIVSIALPLSVGVESHCELLDFDLDAPGELTPENLNRALPSGIRVLSIAEGGRKLKELTHLKATLVLTYDNGVSAELINKLRDFYAQESIIIEKHSRKGKTETNIIPMLCSMELEQTGENQIKMQGKVCAQNPSLNPQLLITALEVYAPDLAPDGVKITREEIFDAQGEIFR